MKLIHHSQATARAGTGKPAETQGRRAKTTLENNQHLYWLSCIAYLYLRWKVKKQAIKIRERKRILKLGKDTTHLKYGIFKNIYY